MGLLSFLQRDPILDYLRNTYDAIPLKVPDTRIKPMTIFVLSKGRARYLGGLADFSSNGQWKPPRIASTNLPEISNKKSNNLNWSVAADLLGPFLSNLSELSESEIRASLDVCQKSSKNIIVRIGATRRRSIAPILLDKAIKNDRFQIPSAFSDQKLLLIDSVLETSEMTMQLAGDSSSRVMAEVAADLNAKFGSENAFHSQTKLTVKGDKKIPFAFTCMELTRSEQGEVIGVQLPTQIPTYGAVPKMGLSPAKHELVGGNHEVFTLDD